MAQTKTLKTRVKSKSPPSKRTNILQSIQKNKSQKLSSELSNADEYGVLQAMNTLSSYDSVLTLDEELTIDANSHQPQNPQTGASHATTRHAFSAKIRKCIADADVILQVVDARNPNAWRSEVLENMVAEAGKKLVFVLNKVDLVPEPTVIDRWITYLKPTAPVCTFRSMTNPSRSKKSTVKFTKGHAHKNAPAVLSCGYEPLGAYNLMNLLKNYTRTDGGTQSVEPDSMEEDMPNPQGSKHCKTIIVGVVGKPNVGKSSVINSLVRNTNCLRTGNKPGITRVNTTVALSENIKLMDTPGVVIDATEGDPLSVLQGCATTRDEGVIEQAIEIMCTYSGVPEQILSIFGVDIRFCDDVKALLAGIAVKRHLLAVGGARNLAAAADVLLQVWRNGEIKYSVEPPKCEKAIIAEDGSAISIVQPMPALDLDNL